MQEQLRRQGPAAADPTTELSYHAVNGMRVRKLFRLLGSRSDAFAQRCFLICDETSRTLSFFFQRASEGQLRRGRPFVLDMTAPQTSPIVMCLQYLSGLVSGGPEVSRTVWQMAGHMSMGEWAIACPTNASMFRRTSELKITAQFSLG